MLGDARENAETLVGNHMDIGRVTGSEDPNYDSIVGELKRMYRSIVEMKEEPMNASKVLNGTRTGDMDIESGCSALELGVFRAHLHV